MTRPFSSIPDGHGTVTLYRHVERGDSVVVAVRRDTPADPAHLAPSPALDPDVYDLLAAVADPGEQVVERLCEIQHDAYEAAAVEAGWETQQRSRKPWSDVPEANKQTMRASMRAVLAALREVTRG